MAGSAISTPTFMARAANIYNADGSTPIYNGGWTFKNASAVTTFAVDANGAATANHSDSGTGDLNHLTLQKQGTTRFQLGSNQSVGLTYQFSATGYGHNFNTGSGGTVGSYSATGAWTFGPSGGSAAHKYYGTMEAISSNGGGNYLSSQNGTNNRWSFGANNGSAFVVYENSSPATGGVYIDSGATSWTSRSDARSKKDIETLTTGLGAIKNIRPVSFLYNEENETNQKRFGFVAQELEQVIKQAVVVPENPDEMWGVSSAELIPVMVKAIQEQQAMIEALQAKVAALEAK